MIIAEQNPFSGALGSLAMAKDNCGRPCFILSLITNLVIKGGVHDVD